MVPMLQCGFVRSNLALAIFRLFFFGNFVLWKFGRRRPLQRAH
jgi:hypothetical protein